MVLVGDCSLGSGDRVGGKTTFGPKVLGGYADVPHPLHPVVSRSVHPSTPHPATGHVPRGERDHLPGSGDEGPRSRSRQTEESTTLDVPVLACRKGDSTPSQ